MGDEIIIRRARPEDITAVADIEAVSFPDPWSAGILADTLTYFQKTFFVATYRGLVIGFIAGGLEDTGEEIYGHICNLAVAGSFRKKGVGKLLVQREEHQFAIELASGVQLEVRLSNYAAQQFYRKIGYREVFHIDRYYANGEDAVVMMKWFRF
ncbi:MAG: ribosomal protein S18-alanine N-acetyltransferase [Methanoregulaceae archaeon]|jgi:ribosomal-protein-alanine N-acetyltransferase|nr:ribosomal protein S18-alanine N-acetyltransferase [Methanoregulaceae archaeon]